jgi:hypothetical protein
MPEVVFIDSRPGRSHQQSNLERIRALSHAAKVSHAARQSSTPSLSRHLGTHVDRKPKSDGGSHRAQQWILPSSKRGDYLTKLGGERLSVQPSAASQLGIPIRQAKLLTLGPLRQDAETSNIEDDNTGPMIVYINKDSFDVYQSFVFAQFVASSSLRMEASAFSGLRADPFGFLRQHQLGTSDFFANIIIPTNTTLYKIFDVNSVASAPPFLSCPRPGHYCQTLANVLS